MHSEFLSFGVHLHNFNPKEMAGGKIPGGFIRVFLPSAKTETKLKYSYYLRRIYHLYKESKYAFHWIRT